MSRLSQFIRRWQERPKVRPWALAGPVIILLICLPLLRPLRHPAQISDDEQARLATIRALVERHPSIYPECACKLAHGFDYVEIDPDGDIGLITTGAGLSMMLIDELVRQGHRPLNFCETPRVLGAKLC